MKKTMIVLSAVFALIACNKVTPDVKNNGAIDASKLVFDITINNASDTKAVKSGWKTGDKVYLFFEDNTDAYVTMTYGADSWGDPTAIGTLSLSATGKKVTAVYVPFNTDAPSYSGGCWQFTKKNAYYMSAEGKEYTVTTDPSTNLSTLSATLEMNNNAGFVQILLADPSPEEGKYVMYAAGLIPTWCGTIVPGGSVTPGTATAGLPIEPMVVAGEGYYFYGTVSSSISEPTFYIVEQDPTNKYAIGTHVKSMSGTGKSLAAKAAVMFTSLSFTAWERWVDLGLSVKWATGNVTGYSTGDGGIVAPTEYGGYYSWKRLYEEGYSYDIRDDGTDTASQLLGGNWRMPTKDEFTELFGGVSEWISSPAGIVVRGANGLAVFFPAAGYQFDGSKDGEGSNGYYWSSSIDDTEYSHDSAWGLMFDSSSYVLPVDAEYGGRGQSVRPVQNIVTP